MKAATKVSKTNVTDTWGKDAPEWVRILAARCDETSQKKAAEEIRYSSAVVNQVLKNCYTGDIVSVEQAVRGAFLNASVPCPVLGTLTLNVCLQHQRAKFHATNSTRVRLYRACRRGCPHSKMGGEA